MEISLFEVLGPVMIGPSSSHTAGAAKLAKTAMQIVGRPFKAVKFGLHGSFAETYKGHGTDYALVAGALGYAEDDERLPQSFEIAAQKGLAEGDALAQGMQTKAVEFQRSGGRLYVPLTPV